MKLIEMNLMPGQPNFMLGVEQGGRAKSTILVRCSIVGREVWFYDLDPSSDLEFKYLHNPSSGYREFAAPLYDLLGRTKDPGPLVF
jgi:hypothetical protein